MIARNAWLVLVLALALLPACASVSSTAGDSRVRPALSMSGRTVAAKLRGRTFRSAGEVVPRGWWIVVSNPPTNRPRLKFTLTEIEPPAPRLNPPLEYHPEWKFDGEQIDVYCSSDGDVADLWKLIKGTAHPTLRGTITRDYRHFLTGIDQLKTIWRGKDISPEGEGILLLLDNSTFVDKWKLFGGGTRCFGLMANPNRGFQFLGDTQPCVYRRVPGHEVGLPVKWGCIEYVFPPIETDGDVADLFLRLRGVRLTWLRGQTSAKYRAFWAGEYEAPRAIWNSK